MGRIIVVVGVEEVVALPVELEEVVEFEVEFEVETGCTVVNTEVATTVFPPDTKVDREVEVITVNNVEDGEDDDDELVEF